MLLLMSVGYVCGLLGRHISLKDRLQRRRQRIAAGRRLHRGFRLRGLPALLQLFPAGCGRLMCCLKYEQEAYEDLVKHAPKMDSFVETPDGVGTENSHSRRAVHRCPSPPAFLPHPARRSGAARCGPGTRWPGPPRAPPRRYKGSEIRVLRNGKGSREGIEIPAERPRRITPEPQEELPLSRFTGDGRRCRCPPASWPRPARRSGPPPLRRPQGSHPGPLRPRPGQA